MNDEPDSPTSLNEFLSDIALPPFVQKNLRKALAVLASSAIRLVAGKIARHDAEKWQETKSRNRIVEEVTTQIIDNLSVSPAYAQEAAHKFASRVIKEQLNRDSIVRIATGQIGSAPKDCSEPQDPREIDDEFLDAFDDVAKSKSTEYMQRLFGRILAGEIQAPGSFSIRGLKIVEQLDQATAKLFQQLCSMCVVLEIPVAEKMHLVDVRVPSLGGNASTNALKTYGLSFAELNKLNEYGLIIPDYNSWHDYRLCILNREPITLPFRHQDRRWVLTPKLPHKEEFHLSGVALSGVGCELFPIVDQIPMQQFTGSLKAFFSRKSLEMTLIE